MNKELAAQSPPPRILPELNDHNRAYWTGGVDGRLHLLFCLDCNAWFHPPMPTCPQGHPATEARAARGTGTLYSYTINQHAYHPDVPLPYLVAIVELPERDAHNRALRVIANLAGCEPKDATIGMSLQVAFEQHGEFYVPVFTPAASQPR